MQTLIELGTSSLDCRRYCDTHWRIQLQECNAYFMRIFHVVKERIIILLFCKGIGIFKTQLAAKYDTCGICFSQKNYLAAFFTSDTVKIAFSMTAIITSTLRSDN